MPRSFVGGVAAREGDLAGDAEALPLGGHASGCLLSSLRVVEGDGEPCLSGCCRALQRFESGDEVDALGVGGRAFRPAETLEEAS